MQTILPRSKWLTMAALLLLLPTVYFITTSILKFEMGVDGPYDAVAPFLESAGLKESFGWNINLLILFGPVLALLIAALQVIELELIFSRDILRMHIAVEKKWIPLIIAGLSGLVLATLFFYLLGENCNC